MNFTVLHVIETFLARSEVFIYNYITAHNRWQPSVLTMSRANESEFPLKNVFTVPLPTTKKSIAWWKAEALVTLTGRSPWHRTVETLISEIRPAVIHAHFGQQGYRMLPIKKRFGIPLITTFYGYDMSVLPRQTKWQKRYDKLFQEGDRFLVEGPYMRERLIELGAPAEKVLVQRIGIFVDQYPSWKPSYDSPTVLFIGRFVEKKGLLYALQAVYEVRKRIRNVRFRIIGDGIQKEQVVDFVHEKAMEDCVTFLGMRPHEDVILELSRAHVLIHPSVTAQNGDSEGGAPTILLEAQAIGVPIVSTIHADIPNVLKPGKGVFLSRERDVSELVSHLCTAIQQADRSDSDFVKEYHDVAREVRNLEETYLKACEAQR